MAATDRERALAGPTRQAYWALQPGVERGCDRAPHMREQADQEPLSEPESSDELVYAA